MLQRIRDGLHGRKWLAWLALAPIAGIFIVWGGSNSFDHSGGARQDAGKVNGETIPAQEAAKAWTDTQRRWSQQFATEIPAELALQAGCSAQTADLIRHQAEPVDEILGKALLLADQAN